MTVMMMRATTMTMVMMVTMMVAYDLAAPCQLYGHRARQTEAQDGVVHHHQHHYR
jgi:hypothetical protein